MALPQVWRIRQRPNLLMVLGGGTAEETMESADLERLVGELRSFGSDTYSVEVKSRSATAREAR
jgi:hypothetical protein